MGGVLFLATFINFGMLSPFLWIWVAFMLIGTFIDIDHHLLPDFVTVGGMVLGLLINAVISYCPIPGSAFFFHCQFFDLPILNSIIGLAVGFLSLLLVRQLGSFVFKREAMGMGDVFLMGAVGAMFGPVAVIFSIMFSALFGSVIGLCLILVSRSKIGSFIEIPYGPYIYLATTLWMFYGPELVNMYLSLLKV
jgi:leader peptidase (prepilin peptidase)/N-methyltransferase